MPAFDIQPYIQQAPAQVRQRIRTGIIDFPTAGMAAGYAQANLVILPQMYAHDFREWIRQNPQACPLLETVKQTPLTKTIAWHANICTDIRVTVSMKTAILLKRLPMPLRIGRRIWLAF